MTRRPACPRFASTAPSSTAGTSVAARERSQIPDLYKWNLADLYPSESAWSAAREDIARRLPTIAAHQGKLGASAERLLEGLTTLMDLDRDLTRVASYANQLHDQDTRVSRNLEKRQSVEQLAVQFRAAASFVRPELLAVGAEKIRALLATEPRLAEFGPYLEDILRAAPHTLGPAEEKVAAQAGLMAGAGESIRSVFTNAEMPYPTVALASGDTVRLDPAAYTLHRASPHRADRIEVFRAFWDKHREFRNTLGSALNAQVRAHLFHKDVHRYGSCLEASLFRDNIPTPVYRQLVADVRSNLPTLHRYLRMRRRMMGLDTLRYEDLYAPIVPEVDLKFTPEEAMSVTLEALAPLGDPYVSTLRLGFASGWVDWLPNPGKTSGAYSTGTYAVHPYQLQNFTGLYDEVGTLAHESGHSMHTHLSNAHQPYATHDYSTFVAEVASTLNENLLFHHMLGRTDDRTVRLFLLGSYLDNLRATLFRQTQFAEFELAIHERAERGETLTGENLSELYLGIVRDYYGHAQGICEIDELYGAEWAYVDHFFYGFYVYQYATSVVASTAIGNAIREEAQAGRGNLERRDAYLRMLASGSSKYPIDLLCDAGVDMTTSAPFQATMRELNGVMDEIERLLT